MNTTETMIDIDRVRYISSHERVIFDGREAFRVGVFELPDKNGYEVALGDSDGYKVLLSDFDEDGLRDLLSTFTRCVKDATGA